MFRPLQSWKFVFGLNQDGNYIHNILNIIVNIRFHKDMLNTDTMQDIKGHMKYLWPFKNKIIGKWLQIYWKLHSYLEKHIPHKIDFTCNKYIKQNSIS